MTIGKTVQHAFSAVAGHCLQLDIDKGRIRISPGEGETIACEISLTAEAGSEAEARALLERVDLQFNQTPQGPSVRSHIGEAETTGTGRKQRRMGRIEADITITVPCRQDLELENGIGEIEIGQLEGNVHVNSIAGDVHIDGVQGEVRVEGTAGKVTLRRLGGPIQVTTVAGDVSAELDRQPGADSSITTTAGGISIALAKSVGLDLDARTLLGRIALQIPSEARSDRMDGVQTLNGGGPLLKLRTKVGQVSIHPLAGA